MSRLMRTRYSRLSLFADSWGSSWTRPVPGTLSQNSLEKIILKVTTTLSGSEELSVTCRI